jgi:hypothetical protein
VQPFLRVGRTGLPLLAGDGPASLRQRTFDYWDEVRGVLAPLRRHPGAHPAGTADCEHLAVRIRDIPTELLDPDAVEAARELADVLAELGQCLRGAKDSGQAVPGPVRRRVQQAFEVTERSRGRLERRYGWTFPPLRWELPA